MLFRGRSPTEMCFYIIFKLIYFKIVIKIYHVKNGRIILIFIKIHEKNMEHNNKQKNAGKLMKICYFSTHLVILIFRGNRKIISKNIRCINLLSFLIKQSTWNWYQTSYYLKPNFWLEYNMALFLIINFSFKSSQTMKV